MKRIAVLGSTGSVGKNALEIISRFPDKFKLVSIGCWSNFEELNQQIKRYRPQKVAIGNADLAKKVRSIKRIYTGQEGIDSLARDKEVDMVLVAINSSRALSSILAALDSAKNVALANKEALVMAGHIIMKKAALKNCSIMPIDSEQSAIWQCLEGRSFNEIKNIYLTASGGPLNNVPKNRFKFLDKKTILKHPRWKMGKKITVDSATLMNKSLEIIEAIWLFGQPVDKIKVIVHPQAIVHSMVEFADGAVIAQLGLTDMKLPIQYALSYPKRLNGLCSIDFTKCGSLEFSSPDLDKFVSLRLGYQAAREMGSMPCVMNAADEEAVKSFLSGEIKFYRIPQVVEKVMDSHRKVKDPSLEEIFHWDEWARQKARYFINKI